MAYPKKKPKGKILPIPASSKRRLGSAGNLGLIGGAGKGLVKIGKKVFQKIAKKVALNKMSNRKKKKKKMAGRTKGKKVCWQYGKGKYCGTLISSMETSTHRYARTENGKVKSLPKNK